MGSNNYEKPRAVYDVELSVPHPKYGYNNYDIGLIKTKQPIIFSHLVRAIALPRDEPVQTSETHVWFAGWGRIWVNFIFTFSKKFFNDIVAKLLFYVFQNRGNIVYGTNILQELNLTLFEHEKCETDFPRLTENQLCSMAANGTGLCNVMENNL